MVMYRLSVYCFLYQTWEDFSVTVWSRVISGVFTPPAPLNTSCIMETMLIMADGRYYSHHIQT